MEKLPDERQRYYRPQWSSFDADGTISIRISVWSDEAHYSCIDTISANDDHYQFWHWLVEHPEFQRTLNEEQLNEAKDRFALESSLS
jgi:hypothetical protein